MGIAQIAQIIASTGDGAGDTLGTAPGASDNVYVVRSSTDDDAPESFEVRKGESLLNPAPLVGKCAGQ